jgi:glycine cleavage system H protein
MANSAEAGFKVPHDYFYTKNHEWARIEDGIAVIGITDYAQSQLGDITYVELPEEGDDFKKDAVFGSVDSLKTVAELYAPLSGSIVEINSDLPNNAERVNEDPYNDGWIIKLEIAQEAELEQLMPADEYLKLISKLSKKK